jgi:hypothetical protein
MRRFSGVRHRRAIVAARQSPFGDRMSGAVRGRARFIRSSAISRHWLKRTTSSFGVMAVIQGSFEHLMNRYRGQHHGRI